MNSNNVISSLIQFIETNLKSNSFLWRKHIKFIINNWRTFTPSQSVGILLAIDKSNLYYTDDGVKLANLLFNNIYTYSDAYACIYLYFKLYYINLLNPDHYPSLIRMYLNAVKSLTTSREHLDSLLPLITITSKTPECQLGPQAFADFYNLILEDLRNNSMQTFTPTTSQSLEKLSLLSIILANYQRYNEFKELLLLIGEGHGDLCSALRLHTALYRIKNSINVKNQLSLMSSHLDSDYLWTSVSQLLKASGRVNIHNLEKFDKSDKNTIDIFLKCTLNNIDKTNNQRHFLYKLLSTGLINRPHKAHIRWNYPHLSNFN